MSGISASWEVQRALSSAQATPIVGPLLVSPVKAVFSTAQLVAGVAGTILFGTLALLTFHPDLASLATKSIAHVGMGALGLMYSVSNFISLGIVSYRLENLADR